MASHMKNMTVGKPLGLILTFALPLMVGNVFQQLYTVVDTMVVGKALGVGALAALGAADWMNWMMLGIVQGFTQGFAIPMAQEFGRGDHGALRRIVGCSVLLSLFFSLGLLAVGQAIARPVLLMLPTPGENLGDALLYLRVMYFGIPIVTAYNLLASVLRSLGDGRTPLLAMIVASVTNISLDLLFVLVFHWGIAGAAAATLIAQLVSGLFCLYHVGKIKMLALSRQDFALKNGLPRQLLLLGAPMAVQNAIISVGGMIVQAVVNGFGVLFIAGFTATNKLYGVLEIAATSYGYAMITYVGQNLGAGKMGRIRQGVRSATLIALVTSAVIAVVMLLAGKWILSCFISGTPEQFDQTLQIAYHYLTIMSLCLPVLYILHVSRSAIQGMGNTMLPLVSGIAEFVMRTLTALLLPMFMGANGIFFAEVIAWAGADVILIPSYFIMLGRVRQRLCIGGETGEE